MINITKEVVDEIVNPENKCIMVLGGVDVGKTVLIENIAKFLSETTDFGIIDLDMGQSNIGPPTTVTTPKDNLDDIRSVVIGGIKINKDGDELK